MGFFDCRCMVTGISLVRTGAVLVVLRQSDDTYQPITLGIKGTYNRLGSIGAIREDVNTELVLTYFLAKLRDGSFTIDANYQRFARNFPITDIERLLNCFERNLNHGFINDREVTRLYGDKVAFAMVARPVWRALAATVAPSPPSTEAWFARLFGDSPIAGEIYRGRVAEVGDQVRALYGVSEFLAARGRSWAPTTESGQHSDADERRFLVEARRSFGEVAVLRAVLEEHAGTLGVMARPAVEFVGAAHVDVTVADGCGPAAGHPDTTAAGAPRPARPAADDPEALQGVRQAVAAVRQGLPTAPDPAVAQRLVERVAASAAWRELADAPDVLDSLDPDAVAGAVLRAGLDWAGLPGEILAVLRARHVLAAAAPADRAVIRGLAMARSGHPLPATPAGVGAWRLAWSRLAASPAQVVLAHRQASFSRSLAVVPVSDGGVRLATVNRGEGLVLRDAATGEPLGRPVDGHALVAALPTPAGHTLLATADAEGTLRLWDPATGGPVGDSCAGPAGVTAVAAVTLPGGRTGLAIGDFDGAVTLWDPIAGERVGGTLRAGDAAVTAVASVAVSDGRIGLATGSVDGVVRVFDPVTGDPIGAAMTGHEEGPLSLLAPIPFLPDGRTVLATAGYEGTVRLWDPTTGTPISPPLRHQDAPPESALVTAVAVLPAPDGRPLLAAACSDHRRRAIWVWDPATGTPAGPPLTDHDCLVYAMAALPLPDGRTVLATGGNDGTLRLWQPTITTDVGEARSPAPVAVVPIPDHGPRLVTGGARGHLDLRCHDPATGHLVDPPLTRRFWFGGDGEMVDDDPVRAIAPVALPDGRILLAVGDVTGRVRLWDPTTGEPTGYPLVDPDHHLVEANLLTTVPLPDGRTLLATADEEWIDDTVGRHHVVRLWDPQPAAAPGNRSRYLRGAPSQLPLGQPLIGHTARITAMTALPRPHAGALLATGDADGTVRLWDPATGQPTAEPLAAFPADLVEVEAMVPVPLPDGRILLAIGGDTVRLWDPDTGRYATDPLTHTTRATALAVLTAPGGSTWLTTADTDTFGDNAHQHQIRLWDPDTGHLAHSLPLDVHPHTLAAVDTHLAVSCAAGLFVINLTHPLH